MTNDEILSLVDSIMHKYASLYRSEAKSMAEEELKKYDEKYNNLNFGDLGRTREMYFTTNGGAIKNLKNLR